MLIQRCVRLCCAMVCVLACVAVNAATDQHYYLTGIMDKDLAFSMTLSVNGLQVAGSYVYDTIGVPLDLAGTIDPTGKLLMNEKDKDVVTGSFSGQIWKDTRTFSGVWSNPDGTRSYPFAMQICAVVEYRELSRTSGKISATGSYPYFLDPTPVQKKLSQRLYGQAEQAISRFFHDMRRMHEDGFPPEMEGEHFRYDIRVAYCDYDLVNILASEYANHGGAHPNFNQFSGVYRMEATAPRLLSLVDLFQRHTDYRAALVQIANEDLRRQKRERTGNDDLVADWEGITADKLSVYTLGFKSMTFYFPPYAAGIYIEGQYQVTIPYATLRPYINAQGPLQRFLQ